MTHSARQKLGFVLDGETMLYARLRDGKFQHVNTILRLADFKRKP